MNGPAKSTVTRTGSLQIQSVLYENSVEDLDRGVDALGRAIEIALESHLERVVVAWGDCSPSPVLTEDMVAERDRRLRQCGAAGLRYTWFGENLGSAEGNNRLWQELDADLVFILNPDTVVAPDAVFELIAPFQERGVGITEARQLPIEHPKDYDPLTGDTSWASGACSLVPASVIREIEGYDSGSFFLYCDDVDFSWRARLAGYRVVHCPSARVFHDKRLSTEGAWTVGPAEEYYSAEGALILAHKYSHPGRVRAIRRELMSHGSDLERKAVATFDRRREAGDLPHPIDGQHAVGQFIKGNYAKHRF